MNLTTRGWAGLLCLALLVIYLPAVGHGFIKDDFAWIAESRVTRSRRSRGAALGGGRILPPDRLSHVRRQLVALWPRPTWIRPDEPRPGVGHRARRLGSRAHAGHALGRGALGGGLLEPEPPRHPDVAALDQRSHRSACHTFLGARGPGRHLRTGLAGGCVDSGRAAVKGGSGPPAGRPARLGCPVDVGRRRPPQLVRGAIGAPASLAARHPRCGVCHAPGPDERHDAGNGTRRLPVHVRAGEPGQECARVLRPGRIAPSGDGAGRVW